MNKPTRAERLKKFEDDIDAWCEGKLELVTRRFVLEAPPEYAAQDVKRIREDLNMSQAEFGRLIGVSRRTVESWEHGHRTPAGAAARTIEMYSNPPWCDHVRLPEAPAPGRSRTARLETSEPMQRPARRANASTARKSRSVAATAPEEVSLFSLKPARGRQKPSS